MEYSRLDLGDSTDLRVSVVRDPMPTLISLRGEALIDLFC